MFVCFSFKPEKIEMDIFAFGPLCSYFAVCNLWKIIKTNIICSVKKPAGNFLNIDENVGDHALLRWVI